MNRRDLLKACAAVAAMAVPQAALIDVQPTWYRVGALSATRSDHFMGWDLHDGNGYFGWVADQWLMQSGETISDRLIRLASTVDR